MFSRNLTNLISVAVLCPLLFAQDMQPVHLQVDPGTPLRLYITKRVSYRQGEPVQAKFVEPVWAFDRIVIPTGTSLEGQVVQLKPLPKMVRAMAMVRGDFTPLKQAPVAFTRMVLPDGHSMSLDAEPSLGLASIYDPAAAARAAAKAQKQKQPAKDPNTKSAQAWSFVKQQAHSQANAGSRGLFDFVRGPNKREWLENLLWSKLPYHPQWYRTGTRFDAVLEKPVDFGEARIAAANLQEVGSAPAPGSAAAVRLLSTVSSGDAKVGEPIAGVLSQPLLSAAHRLVLPEGTRLTGKVTMTRRARMFHRGGQLRFAFDSVEPPAFAAVPAARPEPTRAQLSAAEPGAGPVAVDEEGTAKATESKTRFLRPAIAGLIAAKSLDDDAGKQHASAGANANYGGRTLGGFSGFGLFGSLISLGPKPIGAALGYYGLAWSAYSTIVSRGREVTFEKNSPMMIRFGAPARNR